jgi:hypothetical protein
MNYFFQFKYLLKFQKCIEKKFFFLQLIKKETGLKMKMNLQAPTLLWLLWLSARVFFLFQTLQ